LAQRSFDPVDARINVTRIALRHARRRLALIVFALLTLLAAIEKIAEEIAVGLLCHRRARRPQQSRG
jgi:hypothetical protein